VLSDRLSGLLDADLIERQDYTVSGSRKRQEYAMTEAGLDLLPVMAAVADWSSNHRNNQSPPCCDLPAPRLRRPRVHAADVQLRHRNHPRRRRRRLSTPTGASMSTSLPTTTDAAFADDVLASRTPVLVDFTAEWCGPCRLVTPVLEQLAQDEARRMRVVSLDVDTNPDAARTYGILGMPTMLLFRDGQVVQRIIGARPRSAILEELEPYLA
jgi:thioredoxin 1